MKACCRCKIEKLESDYYRQKDTKDNLGAWCRLCMKQYSSSIVKTSKSKARRRILRFLNKKKVEARNVLLREIKKGTIIKSHICTVCKSKPTECHHPDYEKPLEFIEMCRPCHLRFHAVLNTKKPKGITKKTQLALF